MGSDAVDALRLPGIRAATSSVASAAASTASPTEGEGIVWPFLWSLYAPSLIQATAMGLLIPVLPLRALMLTSQTSLVGAAVSGRGTGLIIGGPIAGAVIAEVGLRNGIIIGLLISCGSAFLGALSPHIFALLATRLIAGIGLSFFQVGRQMYVSLRIPPTSRGMVSSFIAGTTRLGTTVGPAAGGVIADEFTPVTAFWLEGLLFGWAAGVIQSCLVAPTTDPGKGDASSRGSASNGSKTNGSAGTSASSASSSRGVSGGGAAPSSWCYTRDALIMSPVLVVLAFARATRELLLPLKAAELGVSSSEVGGITAASFAVDTALVPLAGYVMDRHGRKYAGAPALAFSAFGLTLVALAHTPSLLLIASIVLGLGMGLSNGWIQVVGADLAPEGSRPQFLGMWNLIMGLGSAIGPLLIGAIAQVSDSMMASLAAAAITGAGAAWYIVMGLETLPRQETPDLL